MKNYLLLLALLALSACHTVVGMGQDITDLVT